jgi:hypothetical protein
MLKLVCVSKVATHKQFCKLGLVYAMAADIFATTVEETGKNWQKAFCITGLSVLLV